MLLKTVSDHDDPTHRGKRASGETAGEGGRNTLDKSEGEFSFEAALTWKLGQVEWGRISSRNCPKGIEAWRIHGRGRLYALSKKHGLLLSF